MALDRYKSLPHVLLFDNNAFINNNTTLQQQHILFNNISAHSPTHTRQQQHILFNNTMVYLASITFIHTVVIAAAAPPANADAYSWKLIVDLMVHRAIEK
jgi:hypothetical protein